MYLLFHIVDVDRSVTPKQGGEDGGWVGGRREGGRRGREGRWREGAVGGDGAGEVCEEVEEEVEVEVEVGGVEERESEREVQELNGTPSSTDMDQTQLAGDLSDDEPTDEIY